jgi:hypothetical protein
MFAILKLMTFTLFFNTKKAGAFAPASFGILKKVTVTFLHQAMAHAQ